MTSLTRQGSTAEILGPAVRASAISRYYGTPPEDHVIVKITVAAHHHKVGDILVWPVAEPKSSTQYRPATPGYAPRARSR